MSRRWVILGLISISLLFATHQAEARNAEAKRSGARVLKAETVVAAPVDAAWKAFTTKQGLEAWLVPIAEVDLRVGGAWKTNYNPKAKIGDEGTIVHHILALEPQRMMRSRFTAPANAPIAKVAEATETTIRFEPVSESATRVTVEMSGWGEGGEWEQAYQHFARGNEYTLGLLKKHFEGANAAAASVDLTLGREPGRSFTLEKPVDCDAQQSYQLWATSEGLQSFLGPARVEPRAGGEFTIIFNQEKDPQALSHGSGGARVLKAVPGREFAFEWPVFVAREDIEGGPPRWPEERNRRPLATWVHLTFEPVLDRGGQTRVRLTAHGFQQGEQWDKSYAYFNRAWEFVLGKMAERCSEVAAK